MTRIVPHADWKAEHANVSSDAVAHAITQRVIAELMSNLQTDSNLVRYGIEKVAVYAAQVARAQALGFDPELLRLTAAEANSDLWEMAARLVYEGLPTTVVETPND